MSEKGEVVGRIRLDAVRLSFCQSLWTPAAFGGAGGSDEGEQSVRHSANFLIPKNSEGGSDLTAFYTDGRVPIMQGLRAAKIDAIAKRLNVTTGKASEVKIKPDNYAVRDGDSEVWDGYENNWYVSANNRRAPKVIGRDRRPVEENDGIIYAGCYVNAIVTLWHQQSGQRRDMKVPTAVWASLEGVQFVKDGDAFGAPTVNVDEDFDDITADSDILGVDL